MSAMYFRVISIIACVKRRPDATRLTVTMGLIILMVPA